MMSAAALLAKTPKPTDKDIDTAMNGNLCRCGTYLRIREAVHKAAELAIAATAKTVPQPRQQGIRRPTMKRIENNMLIAVLF